MIFRHPLLLVSTLTLLACGPKVDDGDDDVGETGGTDDTDTSSTGSSESADDQGEGETADTEETTADTSESADTDGPNESDSSDTVGETDTSNDTDEATTGDSELEQACADACELLGMCFGQVPAGCTEDCIEHHEGLDPDCYDPELAFTECVGGLTCEELDQLQAEEPEPYPCQAEQTATCGGDICEAGVGQGEQPGECSFEYNCPDEDLYAVECDGSECVCLIGGVEVGGCADAVGFCDDVGADAANECCDFGI